MNSPCDTHVVQVCPERDRECGQFPRSWCSTCPKWETYTGRAELVVQCDGRHTDKRFRTYAGEDMR